MCGDAAEGNCYTRGTAALLEQIPIRISGEWKNVARGHVQIGLVGHDGGTPSGQCCFTLTATDVCLGRTERRALIDGAAVWVNATLSEIREAIPSPLIELHPDSGGEFINHTLYGYCSAEGIEFTRGRAYRKNDNCFVEQKNDLAVRRTVGYYRFDTDEEFEALQEVYTHLCPLLNYYYPSMKLIEKTRIRAKVKKAYGDPKPPYQRLLESPHVSQEVKDELRRRAKQLHIVKQKRLVDESVARPAAQEQTIDI